MKKFLGIAALLVIPLAVAFYAGVFSTAFNTNLCYSDVLDKLADKAQAAAASGDSVQIAHYARLMKSLPLAGYESQCERIRAVVDVDLASLQMKNKLRPANQ
jgi:hypothetical protein